MHTPAYVRLKKYFQYYCFKALEEETGNNPFKKRVQGVSKVSCFCNPVNELLCSNPAADAGEKMCGLLNSALNTYDSYSPGHQ